jgi:hypothetical protein
MPGMLLESSAHKEKGTQPTAMNKKKRFIFEPIEPATGQDPILSLMRSWAFKSKLHGIRVDKVLF